MHTRRATVYTYVTTYVLKLTFWLIFCLDNAYVRSVMAYLLSSLCACVCACVCVCVYVVIKSAYAGWNIFDTPGCCTVCICIAKSRVPATLCLLWPKNSSVQFVQFYAATTRFSHGNWHLRGIWGEFKLGEVVPCPNCQLQKCVCLTIIFEPKKWIKNLTQRVCAQIWWSPRDQDSYQNTLKYRYLSIWCMWHTCLYPCAGYMRFVNLLFKIFQTNSS